MQKKLINGLIAAALVASLSIAQARADESLSTLGVGFAFAPIGGHGFSFRNLPQSGFGYQCGTIFWKSGESSYFNGGAELIYVLRHTENTAFYAPLGIAYSYKSDLAYRYDTNPPQQYRQTTNDVAGGGGLGFTARIKSWENIWFSLDLVMYADKGDILHLPQGAIHYYFK